MSGSPEMTAGRMPEAVAATQAANARAEWFRDAEHSIPHANGGSPMARLPVGSQCNTAGPPWTVANGGPVLV
jgi:hypothetical protein